MAKIEFTPRIAHDRCLGCHREEKRGPMKCRECHAVPEPAPPAQQLAAATAGQKLADRTTVGLSATGVSDLVRRTDALGNQVGGVTFAVAATIDWVAAER